jgi:hypothetical protein
MEVVPGPFEVGILRVDNIDTLTEYYRTFSRVG